MRSRSGRPGSRGQRGFVLIGVIMFVLALTILGLSIYSLSSFEVDFLSSSLDRDQAFYDASGGLDRARWILARKGTLQSVKQSIPYGDGVVYAKAWYADTGDSTGAIQWSAVSRPITVRVLAVRGPAGGTAARNQRCLISCSYTPQQMRSIYSNLITSNDQILADTLSQAVWSGDVLQESQNTSWMTHIASYTGNASVGGVPTPDVDGFMSQFLSGASITQVQWDNGLSPPDQGKGRTHFKLTGGSDSPLPNVTVYRDAENISSFSGFAVSSSQQTDVRTFIQTTGTVIWLIPGGARFHGDVVVVPGTPQDRLVIVASPGTSAGPSGTQPLGIWFDGSVFSTIPVILVSSGTIAFTEDFARTGTTLPWLSLFASDMTLSWPGTTGGLSLSHAGVSDSQVLDDLIAAGLLPNVAAEQNRELKPIAGSWKLELKSNPDDPN